MIRSDDMVVKLVVQFIISMFYVFYLPPTLLVLATAVEIHKKKKAYTFLRPYYSHSN